MFLIFGINQNEKRLNFDQVVVCPCCGKYGHVSVFMRYTYFMLFFIPIFKWDRHYYIRLSCCGSGCEIDPALGRDIETGRASSVNVDDLHFGCHRSHPHTCADCGFTIEEDFQYCPKCGRPLN